MRCSRHDLAIAPDGKCVRCRREEEEAAEAGAEAVRPRSPMVGWLLVAGLAIAGGLAFAIRPHPLPPVPSVAGVAPPTPSAPPLASLDPASVPPDPPAPAPAPSGRTPLERAMRTASITLYCRPAAPVCAQTRSWLLGRGYTYKEHDVDAEPEAAAAWRRAAPDGAIPAFDVDGQTFAGFDAARLQGALEYAGARRLQR